jgi:uncharacterized iron-regulated protein
MNETPETLRELVGEEYDSLTHRSHILSHAAAWEAERKQQELAMDSLLASTKADRDALRERLKEAMALLQEEANVDKGPFEVPLPQTWFNRREDFLASLPPEEQMP